MKLQLHINYYTTQFEVLCVEINLDENTVICPMLPLSEGDWVFDYTIPESYYKLTYHYCIRSLDGKVIRREWNKQRTIDSSYSNDLIIVDAWTNMPDNLPYYSSAFSQVFYHRPTSIKANNRETDTFRLEVLAPTLPPDADLILTGESDFLGKWNISRALILDDSQAPLYTISLPPNSLYKGLSYKFAARKRENQEVVAWDKGDNRTILINCYNNETNIIVRDLVFEPELTAFRCAGVAIPVFSLRSENSWGIGEYSDLKLLIDWAKLTGQKIIQVLPINDTTLAHNWIDSYPYNSNSIFALHPIYLNPSRIGTLSNKEQQGNYEIRKNELNSLGKVDYEAVEKLKWDYFQELFNEKKTTYQQDERFKKWYKENREWIIPYSAFCHFRDLHSTPCFAYWGEYAQFNYTQIESIVETKGVINDQCGLYIFLQYHAHLQLSEVTNYAHSQGVILKGDIPIGISRDSVEAWVEPHLFNLNGQAGAPPDDFSNKGQNWGFPTYRWDVMAKDRFAWWKQRFRKMEQYFDAYRIDHLLGFFRIWEIPMDSVEGLLGHFNPALPLSPEEIEGYGLKFDYAQMVAPCLTTTQVEKLFGRNASFAFEHLFDSNCSKHTLKLEYSTQRIVQNTHFPLEHAEEEAIKQALFRTINDVLFVADPLQNGTYHPRIAGYDTFAFQNLDEPSRQSYIRLYEEFFFIRHNEFWKNTALERLSELISATGMLACAEDLGMIPACVPEVMNQLQMLSLEIQRMPKTYGTQFAETSCYPTLSVAATSTHDMSTIREWWEEDREATSRYFTYVLRKEGDAPVICSGEIVKDILSLHLDSPAMLTILPLQDWLATDEEIRFSDYKAERINVPSNPKHYWQYRMHLSLEQLLNASKFNKQLSEMIQLSGR